MAEQTKVPAVDEIDPVEAELGLAAFITDGYGYLAKEAKFVAVVRVVVAKLEEMFGDSGGGIRTLTVRVEGSPLVSAANSWQVEFSPITSVT